MTAAFNPSGEFPNLVGNNSATFFVADATSLAHPVAPTELLDKWRSPMDEPLEGVISRSDATAASEDWSQGNPHNYAYNGLPPHARRLRMIADLAIFESKKRLEEGQSHVALLDMGAGDMALPRLLRRRIEQESPKLPLKIAVADINRNLVAGALTSGLADRGAYWDWNTTDLNDVVGEAEADVLVFAEVLEHIPCVTAKFLQPQLGLAREKHDLSVIGSVPNAIYFAEIAGLLRGVRSPHQLHKAMTQPAFDHVSHFTYSSLSEGLASAGFPGQETYISSNGMQLDVNKVDMDYEMGLRYPHLGQRLIFYAANAS